jgi:hypothetical protein
MPKDKTGVPYTSPSGNKPANAGTPVTIQTNKGPKPGHMVGGGLVVPDKKK